MPALSTVEKRSTIRAVREPALSIVEDRGPKLHQSHQRALVRIEDDIVEASCELTYQRDDLIEAANPENNRLLEEALLALQRGDVVLARQLIRSALDIENAEDAAARRAQQRRDDAHAFTRSAAGRMETVLVGRAP